MTSARAVDYLADRNSFLTVLSSGGEPCSGASDKLDCEAALRV